MVEEKYYNVWGKNNLTGYEYWTDYSYSRFTNGTLYQSHKNLPKLTLLQAEKLRDWANNNTARPNIIYEVREITSICKNDCCKDKLLRI